MTKIKLCGLSRYCDIEIANQLKPDYIGFVFAKKSNRYITPNNAKELKKQLNPDIKTVGVFVNESIENIANLLKNKIIDIAQLHGNETDEYIENLKILTNKPIIKAFRIDSESDILKAEKSKADFILLDSGNGGTGTAFDWTLLHEINRNYFLAGGLNTENIKTAIQILQPYAVDVSSGIETDGFKDKDKMIQFVNTVRKEDKQ